MLSPIVWVTFSLSGGKQRYRHCPGTYSTKWSSIRAVGERPSQQTSTVATPFYKQEGQTYVTHWFTSCSLRHLLNLFPYPGGDVNSPADCTPSTVSRDTKLELKSNAIYLVLYNHVSCSLCNSWGAIVDNSRVNFRIKFVNKPRFGNKMGPINHLSKMTQKKHRTKVCFWVYIVPIYAFQGGIFVQ